MVCSNLTWLRQVSPPPLLHKTTLTTGAEPSPSEPGFGSYCHWLLAPERIKFKLAVIVYRDVHGTAPRNLSDLLHCASDITSRRRLRSSTSSELVIPLSRLVTVGDRSLFCCCRAQVLEHSAWGHYICAVFTGVPTKTEDSFVSAILSGHYIVACMACCARWSLKPLLRPS